MDRDCKICGEAIPVKPNGVRSTACGWQCSRVATSGVKVLRGHSGSRSGVTINKVLEVGRIISKTDGWTTAAAISSQMEPNRRISPVQVSYLFRGIFSSDFVEVGGNSNRREYRCLRPATDLRGMVSETRFQKALDAYANLK